MGYEYQPRRSSRKPARLTEDLDYADDIALIESSIERAGILLRKLDEHAQATGLILNCEKTEHLRLNIKDPTDLKLGDKTIRQVDDFKYLGSLIIESIKKLYRQNHYH